MATSDARPIPIKGTAYRVTFPILDADGDLVPSATGLANVLIKDTTVTTAAGTVTQLGTSGMYFLDLTGTEMTADTIVILITTTSSGAKTTPIVLYPQEAGDIKVDVQSFNGDATGAGNIAFTTAAIGRGTVGGGSSLTSIVTSAFVPTLATADQLKGRIITFDVNTTTAALRGQATDITASTTGSTPTFTVTSLVGSIGSGDTFSVT
jgi:hypothetical protein